MTIHDFLEKWHHPGGQDWPEVEQFNITLRPDFSNRSRPTSAIGFRIECTVCVGIYPRIHETVRCPAIQQQRSEDAVEDLLDQLHKALSQRFQEVKRAAAQRAKPEKPVLAVIAGAGFSAGFGLPVTAGLKELAARPCDEPESHLHELHRHDLERYPLNEYLRDGGSIDDFEVLLTIWEGYRHQLGQVDERREVRHDQCYRRFIEQVCCHLYRLSWAVRDCDSHVQRFGQLADWLKEAKRRYDVRFVTFNYDVILEMLCREAGFAFTYDQASDPIVIPIRKLHGSVNWQEFNGEISSPNAEMTLLHRSGDQWIYAYPQVDRCPYGASGEMPVVIPPMASKSYRGLYEWIWSFAAYDLSLADKVLIVGYSFPPLDAFAEHHLIRAIKDGSKSLTYVLPDAQAQGRIRNLLREKTPDFINQKWEVDHFRSVLDA